MEKDSSIHSLHDSFFKKQFQDIEVARSFFENYLPKEVIQNLELENLRIASNELISKELKKSQTDILFQSKIQDRDGYFHLSLEHQKQVDPHMCLRMFEYYYQIYSNYRKQYPNKKPPLILCFVVYQGSEVHHPKPSRQKILKSKFLLSFFKRHFLNQFDLNENRHPLVFYNLSFDETYDNYKNQYIV